jgi:hypothetical protein
MPHCPWPQPLVKRNRSQGLSRDFPASRCRVEFTAIAMNLSDAFERCARPRSKRAGSRTLVRQREIAIGLRGDCD